MTIVRSLLLGVCVVAANLGPTHAHGVVRYDNGRWFDGEAFRERTVYSVDGRLAFEPTGEVDRVVDLESGFVVPPFGDAHSHALGGPDFDERQRGFLAAGVFYVADPNAVVDWARQAASLAAAPETVDVTFALGGWTSPGGHPTQIYDSVADRVEGWSRASMNGRAYWAVDDRAELKRMWPRMLAAGPDFVKVYLERSERHAERRGDERFHGQRGIDPGLVPWIVRRAHAAGLRVAVHVTSAADFLVAVRTGADEIAHLPLERLDDEAARRAAEGGTVVVTTTSSHRATDGVDDLDALHRHNLRLLRRHGVRLVLGTDSHRSVIDEAQNVARLAGLTPLQTLRLLAVDTPRWIFPDRGLGALEPGREASFLVLRADPLQEPDGLKAIVARVKQGHLIDVEVEVDRPSPAGPLAHRAMAHGAAAAIAEYRRLRKEEADAWDFSEQALNTLGYILLNHGKVDDAIEIFRLNVELFPEAANPYDSLGEAYLQRGDTALAITHYRRSLELNPENHGAREKLRELEER